MIRYKRWRRTLLLRSFGAILAKASKGPMERRRWNVGTGPRGEGYAFPPCVLGPWCETRRGRKRRLALLVFENGYGKFLTAREYICCSRVLRRFQLYAIPPRILQLWRGDRSIDRDSCKFLFEKTKNVETTMKLNCIVLLFVNRSHWYVVSHRDGYIDCMSNVFSLQRVEIAESWEIFLFFFLFYFSYSIIISKCYHGEITTLSITAIVSNVTCLLQC